MQEKMDVTVLTGSSKYGQARVIFNIRGSMYYFTTIGRVYYIIVHSSLGIQEVAQLGFDPMAYNEYCHMTQLSTSLLYQHIPACC